MARIDQSGLMWPDDGDVLQVVHHVRMRDYGRLQTPNGMPSMLVWHLTGNVMPAGCDASSCDGSQSMDGRIASGTARFYAHGLLGRDGVFWQQIPFVRSAIAVSGRLNGVEINHLANHVEVVNVGYAHADDGDVPGGAHIDPTREDFRRHNRLVWQMLTAQQLSAILEMAPAWMAWSGNNPEDCIRGHVDVNPQDGHVDPGPELRAFLDGPVLAKLEAWGE